MTMMKKTVLNEIRMMGMLLMAGGALVACSSNDDLAQQPASVETPEVYNMTVVAQKGSDATMRSTLTDDGTTIKSVWNTTNDVIWVWNTTKDKKATGVLEPDAAAATATLKGALKKVTFEVNDQVMMRTWESGTAVGNTTFKNGQKGTLADIGENWDYCHQTGTVTAVDGSNVTIELNNDKKFEYDYAIVKFTLVDAADGTTPIKPTSLTVKAGTTDIVAMTSIPDETYTDNGNGVLYVAVPAVASQDITLAAKVGYYTYTCTASSKTFEAGHFYKVKAKMTKLVETFTTSTTEWKEGYTYVVPAGEFTINGQVTITGNTTLELTAGATLNINGPVGTSAVSMTYSKTLTVFGTGTLNVKGADGPDGNGTSSMDRKGSHAIWGNGKMIVDGGTITATGGNGGKYTGTDSYRSAGSAGNGINISLTVNGGKVTSIGGNGGTVQTVGNAGSNGVAFYNGVTLGSNIKLYEGTDNTGTLLDGNTGSIRSKGSMTYQKLHAE